MSIPNMPDPYRQPMFNTDDVQRGEKGYSWLFFYASRPWTVGLLVSVIVIGVSTICYFWYSQSGYSTLPYSAMGLGYATIGTLFFILSAISYTIRRHSRKKGVGRLNAALNWHTFFAIMGVATLVMHAFGRFALISGTYALLGTIALSLSGLIGRMLDRLLPRLIAREVHTVLTAQGDDRIETISLKLHAIVLHNNQKMHGFALSEDSSPLPQISQPQASQLPTPTKVSMAPRGMTLHAPWDLAYISLEPTQQELDRKAPHYRFIPDKKSALNRPETHMPGAEEQLSALQDANAAMRREHFYRSILRLWRIFHVFLAFITIGLIIWHLIFATTILFPGLFR
jgi:hypothetical protein